jgi:hypothetical protein
MKKYTILSILLIAIAGLFTYINTNATTTFNLMGINITLLNAVWTMVFLAIFYLISIVYFSIEKYKNFRFSQNVKKDKENLLKNVENKILYKDKLYPIKELVKLEEIVEMVEGLKINPKKSDLEFLNDVAKVENGEIVDLKKYKLDKDNPWMLKLLENKIDKEDIQAAKEALNTPLKDKALKLLSKKADVREILANNYPITKETILNNLESDRLKELIEKSSLSNKDYIEIAQVLHKQTKVPETLLELFKSKIVVYVYLLIEYEMIDKAFELAKEHDIKVFEYYLLLRQNGIKVDIKEYLNATL